MIIAIDGPSGAGKSSLARQIAKALNIIYVDTGALYRTVGLFIRQNNVDPKNAEAVAAQLPRLSLDMTFVDGEQHILLCGVDVGDSIRTPEMSMYASAVSAIPAVRAFLLDTQRDMAKKHSIVMDGRDIGTVIFPDATVKIFLSATPEARARRRALELTAKGIVTTEEEVLADMKVRDEQDRNRAVAPAVPAEDAILLDNSDLSFEGTVDAALEIIRRVAASKGAM